MFLLTENKDLLSFVMNQLSTGSFFVILANLCHCFCYIHVHYAFFVILANLYHCFCYIHVHYAPDFLYFNWNM